VFSIHHDRAVNQDNTVRWANTFLQIQPQHWRSTLAGCRGNRAEVPAYARRGMRSWCLSSV
jgi:hypothetical protein